MPSDTSLSPKAREVLQWLGDNSPGGADDDGETIGELAVEGIQVWCGEKRTSLSVVNQLLEFRLISDRRKPGTRAKYYAINEAGSRWLREHE